MEFLQATDPHEYLSGFNKFILSAEATAAIDGLKAPKDLSHMCDDLKTCGRREFSELLKLRYKYHLRIADANKDQKAAQQEASPELTQEQLEAKVDRELEQTIKQVERAQKRRMKKERERDQKQDLRKKMSVIASTNLNEDLELELDQRTRDKLKTMDLEDIQKFTKVEDSDHEEDVDAVEMRYRFLTDGGSSVPAAGQGKSVMKADKKADEESSSSEEISEDERVTRADRMAAEIDASLQQQKEYQMLKDKKQAKRELKAKAQVDMQRQTKLEAKTDALLANDDLRDDHTMADAGDGGSESEYSENDQDLEEERMMQKIK